MNPDAVKRAEALKRAMVALAREAFCMDTADIQVDPDAQVSFTDDGAWVSGWVWVPFPEDDQEN